MSLEVEDHTNSVAVHCLLIERVFNNVNRILKCLIPLIREVEIIPLEVVVRNVAAGSLATRLGIELPITEGVCAVLGGASLQDLISGLMGRKPTDE